MKDRVTIKDVAQHAGVSIGTVSRYIGNNGYVGKESCARIKEAIKKLHYIPNAAARSMINKKSNIIGVAVPQINNPFLADVFVRLEALLYDRNYSIMMCNTGYKEEKLGVFIDDLIMRNAEGIMLLATDVTNAKLLAKIRRFINGVSVGQKFLNFDTINFDDHKMSYDMTQYLIDLGHTKIASICFNKYIIQTMERTYAVRAALRDNGLPVVPEYMCEYEYQYESIMNSGYICTKKLLALPDPPTAIVAVNDFSAIGAYEAIYESGLQVGTDISVTGYDDIDQARIMNPPLTTVNCDSSQMAALATDMLMERIEAEKSHTGGSIRKDAVLPARLILRGSTGAP